MKTLLLAIPNITLSVKKTYMELSFAASLVGGALTYRGYDVDYIDLNVALNKFPFKIENGEDFFEVDRIKEWIKRPKGPMSVIADFCMSKIPNKKYDQIFMSLDRKETIVSQFITHWSFALALILADRLNHSDVTIGGRQALITVGRDMITKSIKAFPKLQISSKTIYQVFGYKRREAINIPVNNEIVNRNDLLVGNELFPDWFIKKYNLEVKDFYMVPFSFSFDCPWSCGFCANASNKPYLMRAVDAVEKLKRSVDHGHQNFTFLNCNTNCSRRWVMKFCNEIVKNNIKIRFTDSANLRIGDYEMFKALKEAGCVRLWFGTETINDELLLMINKRVTKKKLIRNLYASHRAGIWNSGNIIINLPHETQEQYEEVATLVKKLDSQEIVRTWEINRFKLMLTSPIANNIEQYNIEVVGQKDNRILAFNEIGGLKWADKRKQGRKRRIGIIRTLDEDVNTLSKNDYLLYNLVDRGFDVRKALRDLVVKEGNPYIQKVDPLEAEYDPKISIRNIKDSTLLFLGYSRTGTQSTWRFLGEHPQIYASRIKEPLGDGGVITEMGYLTNWIGQLKEMRNNVFLDATPMWWRKREVEKIIKMSRFDQIKSLFVIRDYYSLIRSRLLHQLFILFKNTKDENSQYYFRETGHLKKGKIFELIDKGIIYGLHHVDHLLGRENILIVNLDEIEQKQNKIYQFLGVDDKFHTTFPMTGHKIHEPIKNHPAGQNLLMFLEDNRQLIESVGERDLKQIRAEYGGHYI